MRAFQLSLGKLLEDQVFPSLQTTIGYIHNRLPDFPSRCNSAQRMVTKETQPKNDMT